MKSFKQFTIETVAKATGETDAATADGIQNFVDKHLIQKIGLPDGYKEAEVIDFKKEVEKNRSADYSETDAQDVYEEIDAELESLDESVLDSLRNIVKKKGAQTVRFGDGSRSKVDAFTASALVQVYDKLNKQNQKKFADTINKTQDGFMKMMDFAMSKTRR